MGYSGAGGKLIYENNQKQKISWLSPFKKEKKVNSSFEKKLSDDEIFSLMKDTPTFKYSLN